MADPSPADRLRSALVAHRAGRLFDAIDGYREILAADANHADALCLLAIVEHRTGHSDEALALIRRALALRPDRIAWSVLGSILKAGRRYDEAEFACRQALELSPERAEILQDLALVLAETGRSAEAEALYRRALELEPDFAEAHNNLGALLKQAGRLAEAEAAYRRALELDGDCAQAHNNLGVLYKESDRLADAEAAYRRAIDLKPDYADARWNLGLVLLTQGRYREAWPCYEARHHAQRSEAVSVKPALSCPQWQGESIAGKSLIVWTEQGHGDFVQFARYVPLLRQRGASGVTLACAAPLKPLLETVAGVDAVVTRCEGVADHDYWVFPMSLPLFFDSALDTLPATLPYLHSLPEREARWRERLGPAALRVGLVWQGNPGHANDANRSLASLSLLAPLWDVPNVRFFSLQKGSGEEEATGAPARQPIDALGADIVDFADTAAIVAQLDLVICVDTAVAHIAGALGKPCWVLLPHSGCDWRWLRTRADSPWYPGVMRLFRQARPGRWDEAIADVAAALARWPSP